MSCERGDSPPAITSCNLVTRCTPAHFIAVLVGAMLGACGGSDGPSETHSTSPAPAIGISVSNASLSVAPGETAALTLTLTRTGTFTGAVSLSADAVPNGVSVSFGSTTIAAGAASATITLGTSPLTSVGSFTLVIHAHGSGVSDAMATIPVTIAGRAANITLAFCHSEYPIWVATQDDQGAWVRALPGANNAFHVAIAARGGVAAVYDGNFVDVTYGTTSELSAYYQCPDDAPTGAKTIRGTLSGVTAGTVVDVALGASTVEVPAGTNNFTLPSVANGPLDLLTTQAVMSLTPSVPSTVTKMIVQRNQNLADGSAVQLDFGGQTAVQPAMGKLTIGGISPAGSSVFAEFRSANGSVAPTYQLDSGSTVHNYLGLPAALTAVGDLHGLRIDDAESTPSLPSSRFATLYFRDVADRTVTMGPAIGTPTLSLVNGGNTPRWRVQLASQPEYKSYAEVALVQSTQNLGRGASLRMTAAYLGTGTPSTWELSIPDLSGAGFDPAWGFSTTAVPLWIVSAAGGGTLEELLTPAEGQLVLGSIRFSSGLSPSMARSTVSRRRSLALRHRFHRP